MILCMYAHVRINIAAGSGHPDYLGHLGRFLSGSKLVLPGHTFMPYLDQNTMRIDICNEKINTL